MPPPAHAPPRPAAAPRRALRCARAAAPRPAPPRGRSSPAARRRRWRGLQLRAASPAASPPAPRRWPAARAPAPALRGARARAPPPPRRRRERRRKGRCPSALLRRSRAPARLTAPSPQRPAPRPAAAAPATTRQAAARSAAASAQRRTQTGARTNAEGARLAVAGNQRVHRVRGSKRGVLIKHAPRCRQRCVDRLSRCSLRGGGASRLRSCGRLARCVRRRGRRRRGGSIRRRLHGGGTGAGAPALCRWCLLFATLRRSGRVRWMASREGRTSAATPSRRCRMAAAAPFQPLRLHNCDGVPLTADTTGYLCDVQWRRRLCVL